MAEWLVTTLLEKLGPLIEEEIRLLCMVNDELDKLKGELETIHEVLVDAEKRQFSTDGLKLWLEKLKDAAYDAEDVIDIFRARAQRSRTTATPVCKTILSFIKQVIIRHDIGNRIKDIKQRLDDISKEKERYNLHKYQRSVETGAINRNNRQTTAAMIEAEIVGRIDDGKTVVDWLVKELDGSDGSLPVVSIVGMGGLGKTTLAQKVFGDIEVQRHFDKRVWWLCVSEKPNKAWLAAKILEAIKMETNNYNQDTALNTLHTEISSCIKGNRFLLVLDDVWDLDWWEGLKATLQGAEPGSRILVTTRKIEISGRMSSIYAHPLDVLTPKQSWSLFLNKALKKDEEERDLQSVRDIAETLVERCKGLPLAIKTLGTVMFLKRRTREDWDAVLNSLFWSWKPADPNHEALFPVLLLSYNDLPSYLKPCFVYCSIFPKDFEFEKNHIVRLWMAEGYISETAGEMEASADEYVEELAGRSLVQVEKTDSINGEIVRFKVHDIVHDLALSIAGKEYSSSSNTDTNTRILSLVGAEENLIEGLQKQKRSKLRTLLGPKGREIPRNLTTNFLHLRVLDLGGTNVTEIPESIGELLLLKYLKASRDTKSLPETIGKLCNLQTLDLFGTQISSIPVGILKLKGLRHLDLDNTRHLKHLPAGLGELTSLRTLTQFILGRAGTEHEANIAELKKLNNLRGNLAIYFFLRIKNKQEAEEANLKGKSHLRSLKLVGEKSLDVTEGQLGSLLPPEQLEILEVVDYRGKSFPISWFSNLNFPCLKKLKLDSLPFLEQLPSLGFLPVLQSLRITDADKVVKVDESFTGRKKGGFEKLTQLTFERMNVWEEWVMEMEQEAMRLILKLSLIGCLKLNKLPHLPSLKQLTIIDCEDLNQLPDLLSLSVLEMRNCKNLTSLPDLPSLRTLVIRYCDGLTELPQLQTLQELIIYRCRNLSCVPELQALKCLDIRFCDQLESLPSMPSLKELYAENCPELTDLPRLPSLVQMEITYFPKLALVPSMPSLKMLYFIYCRMLKELPNQPVLKELSVINCPELETLPHFPRLKKLAASKCPRLQTLWPLGEAPIELQRLAIDDCPAISALPDEIEGLERLKSLNIKACPLLEGWCKAQEHLSKISHIPTMHIRRDDSSLLD
ncbi:disease resistance protein RGA2-like [Nymphaea colorata]|nr:disease resistance protein RGA2-like [Nymphaea colorata]